MLIWTVWVAQRDDRISTEHGGGTSGYDIAATNAKVAAERGIRKARREHGARTEVRCVELIAEVDL